MLPTDKTARKERPIARGVLDYFPDAIAEVARVSYVGNQQHNPGEEMHWARHKSHDHADCIARHLIDRGKLDDDGMRHSAKTAWRALALLQIELEEAASQATPPQTDQERAFVGASNVLWEPTGNYTEGPQGEYVPVTEPDWSHLETPEGPWQPLGLHNPIRAEPVYGSSLTGAISYVMDQYPVTDAKFGVGTPAEKAISLMKTAPAITAMEVAAANLVGEAINAEPEPAVYVGAELPDEFLCPREVDHISTLEYAAFAKAIHGAIGDWQHEVGPKKVHVVINGHPIVKPRSRVGRRLSPYEFDQMMTVLTRGCGCPPKVAWQIAEGTTVPYEYGNKPNVYTPFVYIAGPMRGIEDFNFPAFDRARDAFLACGYAVISPADIDRAADVTMPTQEDAAKATSQRKYAFRDFHALHFLLGENGDGIVMLPNWESSTGAAGELFLARWLGLKVLDEDGNLLDAVRWGDLARNVNRFLDGQ